MFWIDRVAHVSARIMTWEVTTAFDGILTEAELKKRFNDSFREALEDDVSMASCFQNSEKTEWQDLTDCEKIVETAEYADCSKIKNNVLFWPLISFNASDGRKHRFLVSLANEPLECYRNKYNRCLPKQVMLYAIADKILRGEESLEIGDAEIKECKSSLQRTDDHEEKNKDRYSIVNCSKVGFNPNGNGINPLENGNLLFTALWKNRLYSLIFMGGRLCHWSEECGYGNAFDANSQSRIERFKNFMKTDELFANGNMSNSFAEIFIHCDNLDKVNELFLQGAKDPFWRNLNLNKNEGSTTLKKGRWTMKLVAFAVLCFVLILGCENFMTWKNFWGDDILVDDFIDTPPIELSLPAKRDLELLAWAEGHRDLLPAKWKNMRDDGNEGAVDERRSFQQRCASLDIQLLGIVGGRAVLIATSTGETKTLSLGDSILQYRVKSIGMNDFVLRCAGKEERYEIGAR